MLIACSPSPFYAAPSGGAELAAAAPAAPLAAPEPAMKIVRNYKKPEVLAAEARARSELGGGSGMGVIENKPSTDIEYSPPPPPDTGVIENKHSTDSESPPPFLCASV